MRDQAAGKYRGLVAAGAIVLGLAAGFAVRYLLVEAPELAWACGSLDKPWWCGLREGIIAALRWQGLGLLAAIMGAFALLRRPLNSFASGKLAGLAILSGAAGLLLYAPELSAAGLLLGSLRLLRS